jgi:hypothetical protein
MTGLDLALYVTAGALFHQQIGALIYTVATIIAMFCGRKIG